MKVKYHIMLLMAALIMCGFQPYYSFTNLRSVWSLLLGSYCSGRWNMKAVWWLTDEEGIEVIGEWCNSIG